jgi:hypothetical protein
MRFAKGQSGNPGGRPRVVGEVRELARQHGPAAIEALATIMDDPESAPAAKIAAATVLLDRGYGKPRQDVGVDMASHLTTSLEDAATEVVDLVRAFGLLGKLDPDLQAMIEAREAALALPGPSDAAEQGAQVERASEAADDRDVPTSDDQSPGGNGH